MVVTLDVEGVMQRITKPPTREEFEARVKTFCTKVWLKKVMRAWDKCGEVHIKKREDKSAYRDHPRAATWILIEEIGIRDPRLIILELLHDTGEEKEGIPFVYQDVEEEYKDFFLTCGHKAITKLPGQLPQDYTRQVFVGGIKVVIVKFGDRLHNVRTLSACKPAKQDRIIFDTWMYYFPYTDEYKHFLKGASKKDIKTLDLLWELINTAIEELLAKR